MSLGSVKRRSLVTDLIPVLTSEYKLALQLMEIILTTKLITKVILLYNILRKNSVAECSIQLTPHSANGHDMQFNNCDASKLFCVSLNWSRGLVLI
jgi:hypothetical protein